MMIKLFQRLLDFSGTQKSRLIRSFIAYLISSFFEMIPIMAILTVLSGILMQISGGQMPGRTIWISLGIMLVSIVGRIIFINLSSNARTLGSFAFGSEKRMEIGEKLKKAPMGYFNKNRLGDITAAVTTTLGDLEQQSVTIMENVAGGFIHAIVIGVWLLIYEWRIGLISLAGLAIALIVYSFIGKVGKKYAPRRQAAQADLVTAVLEYVQGMGVVKAFGLAERSGKVVDAAIEESREANILLEKAFSKMTALYQSVFKFARAAFLVVAPYLLICGSITPEKCLLLLVSSFMIYSAVEVAGSMSGVARAVEASLDRLDGIMDIPSLDENGQDITPKNYDIEIKDVSFGYDEKEILHHINLSVTQGTSCAIVGPSGSGKTTLCHLIARFWDVDDGQILLGGRNVREYTSDSLLRNFAIVFQNVYLFEDTIANNIRFGRPDATEKEMIMAAKKACCHDFIMALPKGYQTKIGEGGSSLSGGEKQRISIARAILKDAPIIILDEATASVDPENEQELQKAIAELTKDKTILMIAHRLSTVREADQIIVLQEGRIVQRGTHKELMENEGLYKRFVGMRSRAIGWALRK
ncbi:ABC transporter ATP-binding protein [Lachnoclostridium sp. Marseille-P6806]|uniref:ABC transporter ATP-binding protein n=1 Tax=Lachnoclostridium sp. Marseille-P6806 TaxID=2364793 RepID=UPI002ECFC066